MIQVEDPLSADVLTSIFRSSPKDPSRIINREGAQIEFKESYNHAGMAQYFKTMAAFANNIGGYIIFGVGDKPRRLIGLKGKNLKQFEEIKVEDLTNNLFEYFSPEIRWDHCTFEFGKMFFGVIYTYPLFRKPCICKKSYDNKQNPKHTLKEGDIYYRYGGRSERIHYEELQEILDDTRKKEEEKWIDFVKKAATIGIENASLLDLKTGIITGEGGAIVIDEELLSKIAFIKEGHFVETNGQPTLRLIGDIQQIDSGKIIVKEKTKNVVRAIAVNDIITSFLKSVILEEPMEYFKVACSSSSSFNPVYYLINQAGKTINDAIEVADKTTTRSPAKKLLLERLNGKVIPVVALSNKDTYASRIKRMYHKLWLKEKIELHDEVIKYCLNALLSLEDNEIIERESYIKETLLKIYEQYYETAGSNMISNLRKAICRVDEAIYRNQSPAIKEG